MPKEFAMAGQWKGKRHSGAILVQHTDWNISDIAYALGFAYPTYFNNYFKRMTGTNPKSLRTQEN